MGHSQRTDVAAPWPTFAAALAPDGKIALASFLPARHNYVRVVAPDGHTTLQDALPADRVVAKTLWSPAHLRGRDFLAAVGDGVTLWRAEDDAPYALTARLIGRRPADATGPPAPLTSADWSALDPTLLVAASYDTTCAVWCLETGTIRTQLIAHDREVLDVAFSPVSPDAFVSVGADGSMRLFDVRALDHSTILFEAKDARPLLRVRWAPTDANYIAAFGLGDAAAVVVDMRMPSVPATELPTDPAPAANSAQAPTVVDVRWAPDTAARIAVADAAGVVRIWDTAGDGQHAENTLALDAADIRPGALQHVLWPEPARVALCCADGLTLLSI